MDTLREEIRAFLHLGPAKPGSAPVVLSEASENGFVRKLVAFVALDGEIIQAFFFEPTTKPRAGVVLLHQHHSDWSLGKSELAGLAGDPLQAFGPALARAGLSVLAPDALGFESRRDVAGTLGQVPAPLLAAAASANDWQQYYNHAMHRLVRGQLLMTKLLGDISAAATALHALSPGATLGVAGHSFGGNLALFAAALDTRFSFAVASGSVCSFHHKLAHGTALEMALVIPDFASRFDLDDLLCCVAPRKILVVSADNDAMSADATGVVASAKTAFDAVGAADHLTHLHVPGGHALDQQRFDAIVEWLSATATDSDASLESEG